MALGLKTKKTLIDRLAPPSAITQQIGSAATKARRAWIAATIAEVMTTPNRECKVVGKGSYETVHVYEITQQEGRLRHRGHCQLCGGEQVVDAEVKGMVLHGYNRPGDGYLIGRCPGVNRKPLEQDQTLTEQALAEALKDYALAQKRTVAATKAAADAREALFGGGKRDREPRAIEAQPSEPRKPDSWTSGVDRAAYPARLEAYKAERATWAAKYPLHAAWETTREVERERTHVEWQIKQQRDHFQFLLDRKYLGNPLIEEVIV